MSFTRVPKASSATFRAVSFPDELSGIEKSSAHKRKTTIEKKKRIVQLVDTFRKAVSYDVTRNTIRCCGELDFARHNIISTCDRLRIVLHSAEGTVEEWSTMRNVSMEHAKLEVAAHSNRLLKVHVESVRKLGNEIRERIILGFSSAFESAMNGNPSGALDLVEAAEMYERAAETFEKKWNAHGNIGGFIDWLGFKNNIMLLLSPHTCRRLRLRFPRSMLETDSDSALNDLIAAPFLAAVFALHSRPML
jgi:hypothetical protein